MWESLISKIKINKNIEKNNIFIDHFFDYESIKHNVYAAD